LAFLAHICFPPDCDRRADIPDQPLRVRSGGMGRESSVRFSSETGHHRDKPSALLWPRKRTVSERIAAGYEVEAEREGQSAEQRDS
jgi:hypothetical protein